MPGVTSVREGSRTGVFGVAPAASLMLVTMPVPFHAPPLRPATTIASEVAAPDGSFSIDVEVNGGESGLHNLAAAPGGGASISNAGPAGARAPGVPEGTPTQTPPGRAPLPAGSSPTP